MKKKKFNVRFALLIGAIMIASVSCSNNDGANSKEMQAKIDSCQV